MAIAWLVFRENVDSRILTRAFAILAGAVLLSWQHGKLGMSWPAVAICGACISWGIDNNLTRKLSAADPVEIAMIKGFAAGAAILLIALSRGSRVPSTSTIINAGTVGFFGYGVSLALFVLALRYLGTARTSAYFSTAPFIGAVLSLILFKDEITWKLAVAAALMGTGIFLHISDRHEHEHVSRRNGTRTSTRS